MKYELTRIATRIMNRSKADRAQSGWLRMLLAMAMVGLALGCASILKYENSEKVLQNKEFDAVIQVREIYDPNAEPEPEVIEIVPTATPWTGWTRADWPTPTPALASKKKRLTEEVSPSPVDEQTAKATPVTTSSPIPSPTLKSTPKPKPKPTPKPTPTPKPKATPKPKKGAKAAAPVDTSPKPRQPRWEDSEGFVGRRPVVDPYTVGEEVVLDISYFLLDAGELTMQTRSFVEVNGRKAYRFHAIAKTVSVFENFYKVNDYAETLVDFETMLPVSYTLDVKESKILRDARAIHDLKDGQPGRMQFWDKKITSDNGPEERKMDWEMLPYSQNIFSSLWYLRSFTLTPGKKIKFNLAHENENIVITCEVLRREKLRTNLGEFDTIVIRPSAEKDGQPKSIGDNLFWLTDDSSKQMIRMESKIKIGTIVGSLAKLKRGHAARTTPTPDPQ